MKRGLWTAAVAGLLLCGVAAAGPAGGFERVVGSAEVDRVVQSAEVDWVVQSAEVDWVVQSADNVCGVSEARRITNPAKVSYGNLLEQTEEMQEMKRKGIDKDSPEGQILLNKATDRVRRAAQKAMNEGGYCSVWKSIRNRKGRDVPDITSAVEAKLGSALAGA